MDANVSSRIVMAELSNPLYSIAFNVFTSISMVYSQRLKKMDRAELLASNQSCAMQRAQVIGHGRFGQLALALNLAGTHTEQECMFLLRKVFLWVTSIKDQPALGAG